MRIKRKILKIITPLEFKKITNIFEDPYAVEFIDESHSTEDETRDAIIGATIYGLVYLVLPNSAKTNCISLRRVWRKIGWRKNMKKIKKDIETSKEAKKAGLKRIERKHSAKKGEVKLSDCKVRITRGEWVASQSRQSLVESDQQWFNQS